MSRGFLLRLFFYQLFLKQISMAKQLFRSQLFDFAYFPSYDTSIKFLADILSDKEEWDFSDATEKNTQY